MACEYPRPISRRVNPSPAGRRSCGRRGAVRRGGCPAQDFLAGPAICVCADLDIVCHFVGTAFLCFQ